MHPPTDINAPGEPLPKLRFLARYIAFWVAYFTLLRFAFLGYHGADTAALHALDIAGLLVRGARMDLSAACYLAALPMLLLALSPLIPTRALTLLLSAWSYIGIFFAALLASVDFELFSKWGSRIDSTLLPYLRTPREAAASAESSPLALLALLLFALIALGALGYRAIVERHLAEAPGGRVQRATLPLLLTGLLLLVPIRGGLQWTPLNPSSTYFSHSDFANQAGLNVAWNFLHSLTIRDYRTTNPYAAAIAEPEARALVDSLLRTSDATTRRLLRVRQPNVILIIWESATAKVIERLGGFPGITPHFDSLSHTGVLFDEIYASGNRSAKGLAAILSGWPAQNNAPILSSPARAARLPGLAENMARAGYHTAFYYGGELEFADFKSYLVAHGFDRVVGEQDFDRKDWSSKWGAHDHIVLARLLRDAGTAARPFFTTLFTLSSHEPYDVPMVPVIKGSTEEAQFLNAHVYADRSIGEFVARASHESWWDSTLIIIIADHGHPLPRLPEPKGEISVAALPHSHALARRRARDPRHRDHRRRLTGGRGANAARAARAGAHAIQVGEEPACGRRTAVRVLLLSRWLWMGGRAGPAGLRLQHASGHAAHPGRRPSGGPRRGGLSATHVSGFSGAMTQRFDSRVARSPTGNYWTMTTPVCSAWRVST